MWIKASCKNYSRRQLEETSGLCINPISNCAQFFPHYSELSKELCQHGADGVCFYPSAAWEELGHFNFSRAIWHSNRLMPSCSPKLLMLMIFFNRHFCRIFWDCPAMPNFSIGRANSKLYSEKNNKERHILLWFVQEVSSRGELVDAGENKLETNLYDHGVKSIERGSAMGGCRLMIQCFGLVPRCTSLIWNQWDECICFVQWFYFVKIVGNSIIKYL